MKRAITQARRGIKYGQTPFGACIVRRGKILAAAHNRVWKDRDITAHAEIMAIRQACRKARSIDLSGAVMYTTCEPCPMCFAACHWARIQTVVFGARIRDAQNAGFHELTIPAAVMKRSGKSPTRTVSNFMRPQAVKLFEEWRKSNKSSAY